MIYCTPAPSSGDLLNGVKRYVIPVLANLQLITCPNPCIHQVLFSPIVAFSLLLSETFGSSENCAHFLCHPCSHLPLPPVPSLSSLVTSTVFGNVDDDEMASDAGKCRGGFVTLLHWSFSFRQQSSLLYLPYLLLLTANSEETCFLTRETASFTKPS